MNSPKLSTFHQPRFLAACRCRRTLLEDVRKHSDSLLHPTLASKAVQADGEYEGGSKYWRELVDTFFVSGAAKGARAQDDMLFFVRKHVSGDSAPFTSSTMPCILSQVSS